MMNRLRAALLAALALAAARPSAAAVPYPANPIPCDAAADPATCIPAGDFARYLFLPATTPLTLPNDFGGNNWKLTSERTGEAAIDNSAQELFGVKGASVDRAWQVTTGRPDVLIAVLDSGIRWGEELPELVNKFYLNRRELPVPEGSANAADPWDRNADGVFNVRDYRQDARLRDENGNGMIDPEDLIFLFSDGVDDDGNGYVDDIAGWDFFEDDNDPLDEVRYGHGTGEAEDSTAEAGNGRGDVGTCPNCMVVSVRVGDSFVAEVNSFAQGVLYAVDIGALVVQEALGALNRSRFAQEAIDYAYARGVVVVASAADEESNHHNFPAAYSHTLAVNSVTRFGDFAGLQQTPRSYLYLNGCTNYGAYISVSVPSSACSSEATGKSSGMAGLLYSAALNEIDRGRLEPYRRADGVHPGFPLSANEVKQLITRTADDINFDARPDAQPPLPQSYSTSTPFPGVRMSERFPSVEGWDQYFGYGRVNADAAVRRVAAGRIPPEASFDTLPDWFTIVDPGRGSLTLTGFAAAKRAASYSWVMDAAAGVQPAERDFVAFASQQGLSAPQAVQASLPLADLAARMPHGVEGSAVDADGKPDPDRFSFTVRLRVTDNLGNVGEDRRSFFLHHDPDLAGGEVVKFAADGGSSPVAVDLDGDGVEEIVFADSDGAVNAYRGNGSQLPGWPVHTDPIELHTEAPAFAGGEIRLPVYGAVLGGIAVGDLDRDGIPEVVAADLLGKLYVWNADGTRRGGFPVSTLADYSHPRRSERDLSTPEGRVPDRTHRLDQHNRLHRGFGAGPALGNLDGSADGSLEIVIGANDRHVYAWHADGSPVPGWPALLKDPDKVKSVDPVTNRITLKGNANAKMGTKIITPASLGDIDGDGRMDVVVGVNEEYRETPNAAITHRLVKLYSDAGVLEGGNGRVYALFDDGTLHAGGGLERGWNPAAFRPGWPVKVAILNTELLPVVGTGINGPPALADLDHDGRSEVGVFSYIGPAYVFNGQGDSYFGLKSGFPRTLETDVLGRGSDSVDAPAFAALGGGAFAEMNGRGGGFQFVAPTAGVGKLIDNNLAARQIPAENQLGVWDVANADGTPASGKFRPAFPRRVNDLQFLTAPAVADLDSDGLPEAIEGSGVYDLHAMNLEGIEPPGWPKFTGGWTAATAAVGDFDGDGRREVTALTREGSWFVFRTSGGECGEAPWRKSHHDEWSTGNYDTDARPPAPLVVDRTRLSVQAGTPTIALGAVPGDDLYCGVPAQLEVRYAAEPIRDAAAFEAAAPFRVVDPPVVAGRNQAATVRLEVVASPPYGSFHVAARAVDDAGNRSPVTDLGTAHLGTAPTPTATPMRSGSDDDGCAIDPGATWPGAMWLLGLPFLSAVGRRLGRARQPSGGGRLRSALRDPHA